VSDGSLFLDRPWLAGVSGDLLFAVAEERLCARGQTVHLATSPYRIEGLR
jgi:hypothetical protein